MEKFFQKKSTKRPKEWKLNQSEEKEVKILSQNLNPSKGNLLRNHSVQSTYKSNDIRSYEKIGKILLSITLSLENALAGAGIYKDGVAVTQVTAGDSITVRVPASSLTNQNQQFTIKGDTTKTIYNVYQYQPDDTQYQPIMTPEYYETNVQGSGNTIVQGQLEEEPPVEPTYSITINLFI